MENRAIVLRACPACVFVLTAVQNPPPRNAEGPGPLVSFPEWKALSRNQLARSPRGNRALMLVFPGMTAARAGQNRRIRILDLTALVISRRRQPACTFVGENGILYPPFRGESGASRQFDTTFPLGHGNLSWCNRSEENKKKKSIRKATPRGPWRVGIASRARRFPTWATPH